MNEKINEFRKGVDILNRSLAVILIGVLVVLVIVVVLPFFSAERQITEEEFGIGGGPGNEERVNENTANNILQNPEQYIGRSVTAISEIEELLTDNVFSLDTLGIVGDELLVVADSGVLGQIEKDNFDDGVVRVSGVVRIFSTQEVENEIGVDLDDDIFNSWNGVPYIHASQVEVVSK